MKKTKKEVQSNFDRYGYCKSYWKAEAEQKDQEEIL